MKKMFVCLSLLSLFFVSVSFARAQSRPRRVPNPTPQTTQTQPQQNTEPTTSPSPEKKKPVLIGDNKQQGTQPTDNQTKVDPNAPIEVDENEVVRVETSLVTIPVSVMDRNGKFVANLRKEDFKVFEDNVEHEVAYFATVETPFTVALMIDMSGSTRNRLQEIQDAAMAFVDQLRADDSVMVIAFDDDIDVLCEATSDRRIIRSAIYNTRPGDGTKLYDAVDFVINRKLNYISGRKAIVLFTDGVDTTSRRASYESTLQDAEELDALIYPVQYDTYADLNGGGSNYPSRTPVPTSGRKPGLGDLIGIILGGGNVNIGGGGGPGSSRSDYERADRYLNALANTTGARVFREQSSYTLRQIFGQVAEELRKQYSIGYYPKNQSAVGTRHSIRVRVMRPNLAVRARDSYITGQQSDTNAQTTKKKPTLSSPLRRIR
jgi:VWFA-related protein